MKIGDRVQFVRDVTWFDLFGKIDRNNQSIAVPIWEVGVVRSLPNKKGFWAQIDCPSQPVGYGYPPDCYEVIPPTQ